MSNDVEDYGTNLIMATAIPLASTSVIVSSSSKVIDNNNIPSSQDDSAIIESPSSSPPPIAAEQPRGTRPQVDVEVGPPIENSHRHVESRNDVPNNERATTSVIRSSNRNNNVVIDEEQIAIDTDTDDDVILVQQPVETIELGEDDDDDEEVQIINTNQPIPKPLPAKKRKYVPSATIPPTPRLPESSIASSSSAFSLLNDEPDMPEIGPLLHDLLDDYFGPLDFDIPLSEPASLASAEIIPSSSNSNGKSSGDLFITKSTTTEIAIQTDDYKPCVVNMETQTDESSLIKKRKW